MDKFIKKKYNNKNSSNIYKTNFIFYKIFMLFSMIICQFVKSKNIPIYCKFSNNKIFWKTKKILRKMLYLKRCNKLVETIIYN